MRLFPPFPFKRGAMGAEEPFHNRITGNFMVSKDRLETNLLQLFAHPQNSECFCIISAIVLGQSCCCAKTSVIGNGLCVFLQASLALNSFTASPGLLLFQRPCVLPRGVVVSASASLLVGRKFDSCPGLTKTLQIGVFLPGARCAEKLQGTPPKRKINRVKIN